MRLLIVGLGSMGKRRARLLKQLDPAFSICGVDSAPARRSEAEALGITVFPDMDAALARGPYDAGFVCTAPLSHAAVTRRLLGAGLAVFSEINLVDDDYPALMALAEGKGALLFLSSTMLYRAEIAYIQNKITSFAKPVNYIYHIGQYLPDWHPWENYRDFFVGNARTGGVREILGIELPWLVTAFGEATPAFVQKNRLSGLDIPYDDCLFVALQHQSGAMGTLVVDVVCPKAVRNLEVFGEGLQLFWEGSPHSLYDYDPAAGEKRRVALYQALEQDPHYSDNIVENAYVDELRNFFDALAGRAAPRWDFERDAGVIRLMDAIEAAGGKAAP